MLSHVHSKGRQLDIMIIPSQYRNKAITSVKMRTGKVGEKQHPIALIGRESNLLKSRLT